jgi:hypothetical protein
MVFDNFFADYRNLYAVRVEFNYNIAEQKAKSPHKTLKIQLF